MNYQTGFRGVIDGIRAFSRFIPFQILMAIPLTGFVPLRITDRVTILMKSDGDYISKALFWRGLKAFEPETIAWFLPIIRYCSVVADIGANTGIYTLLAAQANPQCTVYAFEPVPRVCEQLKQNVSINAFSRVIIEPNAVADRDSAVDLYIAEGLVPTSSSTKLGFCTHAEQVQVKGITLDSFAAQRNIKKFDVLKIDTEGTEDKVIAGTARLIERDTPIIICEILPEFNEEPFRKMLDPLGYTYWWITSNGLKRQDHIIGDPLMRERNYVFLPPGKQEVYAGQENR